MNTLFNINVELKTNLEKLEEIELEIINNGGELTPELEEEYTYLKNALSFNEENLEEYCKIYSKIINVNESNNLAIDNEIERLKKHKTVNDNIIKKLKEQLLEVTKTYGYIGKSNNKKLDFDTLKLYTRETKSVDIYNEFNIPEEYKSYTINSSFSKNEIEKITQALPNIGIQVTTKFDKIKIKKDLILNNNSVMGATLKVNESINIK